MSSKLATKYKFYCEVIVSRLFADMMNPSNQGPGFKWSDFPDMAESWSQANYIHLDRIPNVKTQDAIGKYAYEIGKEFIARGNMTFFEK